MSLIASISGIRGTIGGPVGENLTPIDIVSFASAYGRWLLQQEKGNRVVIGRDARPSGPMVQNLVVATLTGMGIDVVDLGLATTPTVEMAVVWEGAAGGIIITASHNPANWNALKLLNHRGEFISAADGEKLIEQYKAQSFDFATVENLGSVATDSGVLEKHIEAILNLPRVDRAAIAASDFKIVVDAVNSVGGIAVPALLRALGVTQVTELNCEPSGNFAHNPEPLKENLGEICNYIREKGADLGIVVDPDVDRLALVMENGELFGEEYTLVAVADYLLEFETGHTVSNLSSSRALRELTAQKGGTYSAAAVGEVNVVVEMKAKNAIIGGEGNGGIIYPDLHFGRDALVGIALFLSHLARKKMSMTALRNTYPAFEMAKTKIQLSPGMDVDALLRQTENHYRKQPEAGVDTRDGVKIDFAEGWVHLRKSNTEPIIRIYAEAATETGAFELAEKVRNLIVS